MRSVSVDTCGKIAMPALSRHIRSTGMLQKSLRLQVDLLHVFRHVDVSDENIDAKFQVHSLAREAQRFSIANFFSRHILKGERSARPTSKFWQLIIRLVP